MNLLQSYFKRTTSSDLRMCSIDDVDIVIYNRVQFEIVDRDISKAVKMMSDLYGNSVKNYSYTSPKDELMSLTNYKLKFY
jgi:aspartate carbamoyltransferase catalytic subunit